MPIVYDATRLFWGPLSLTPRGIDRVDFAYAKHFFEHSQDDCFALLPTGLGARIFPRERVVPGLARLEELWAENRSPDGDMTWSRFVPAVNAGPTAWHCSPNGPIVRARRMASLLGKIGVGHGQSAVASVAPGSIYLNAGHLTLSVPFFLRWLNRRPDIKPVFMIHDVIPLNTPEYTSPRAARFHASMLEQTARYAAGLIATTRFAQKSIETELERRGAPKLPAIALPLPVPSIFHEPPDPDPALAGITYFVICGSIELRKNHLMLLEVWKRLYQRFGQACPRLIVVGSKGWQGDLILDRLKHAGEVSGRIHVLQGLSTPALKRLMSGARALLMPSMIEGFGMPIAEANAIGTPVIASDIPAHREVGGPGVIFVDPLDGPGWEHAIVSALSSEPMRSFSPENAHNFTWLDYFRELTVFLRTIAASPNMEIRNSLRGYLERAE